MSLLKSTLAVLFTFILLAPMPAQDSGSFAPFETWKAAVAAGNEAALAKLYSSSPAARTQAGRDVIASQSEVSFWAGLKASGVTELNPRLLEVQAVNGNTVLVLRVTAVSGGQNVFLGMQQLWARQADGWRIVASRRSPAFVAEPVRRLPQPAKPNVKLYPDPREAGAELKAAYAQAAAQHKRVLAIFGGNWCYDCHVLDTTMRSKDFAPLVEANYVVVHINIGDEGKDNNDLAERLGAVLDKGVPSLVVIDPDGKVVFAQANGEFESTVKIGPEDVRAFLEKWRPKAPPGA